MKLHEKYLVTEIDKDTKVKVEWKTAFKKVIKTLKSAKTDDQIEVASKMIDNFYKIYKEPGMDWLGTWDVWREYGIKNRGTMGKLQDKLGHQKSIVKHLDKLKKGSFK